MEIMCFIMINTWISENKIEDITDYASKLSEKDYKLLIDELIHGLLTTTDNNYRNTSAIVLGDLKCDKAIEPLIELINNPKLENCRGTLIYTLENFNIVDRLDTFIKLFVSGNFEVKRNIYTLFEKQSIYFTENKKTVYLDMLKKEISNLEESLDLMYDLCSNVFGEIVE